MSTIDIWVEVEIQNLDWEIVGSFMAKDDQSFYSMAESNNIELPVSCCSWACFVCACKVLSWAEAIDIGKVSVPLVDLDDGQILSCVGGVLTSFLNDWKYHKIVLQKLL